MTYFIRDSHEHTIISCDIWEQEPGRVGSRSTVSVKNLSLLILECKEQGMDKIELFDLISDLDELNRVGYNHWYKKDTAQTDLELDDYVKHEYNRIADKHDGLSMAID